MGRTGNNRNSHDVSVKFYSLMNGGYYRDIVMGFASVAIEQGWRCAIYDERRMVTAAYESPTDVVIVNAETIRWLPEHSPPPFQLIAADVDRSASGIPSVVIDNHGVGTTAARHLMERGLRSFGVFGQSELLWSRQRADGFRAELRANGLDSNDWFVPEPDPSTEGTSWNAAPKVKSWIDSLPKPVGLFACCDSWAHYLSSLSRTMGVRIPEEVAIVGVDNDPIFCELDPPRLSSVVLPTRRLGQELGRLIVRLLEGQPPPREPLVLEPGAVVARRSSDVIAVDDPDVAAALTVIRDHAERPLSVTDVLRLVPASQKRLEQGFRRYVGRTMLAEIRRIHIEQAKRLLSMTDLRMADVAEKSGFASAIKLSVAFRQETGVTPTEYRARFRARSI